MDIVKRVRHAAVALAVFGTTSAFGAMAGTPHDLSDNFGEDNGEICVYCHTPHAANSAFAGAPIWNKNDAAGTANDAYTMYGTTLGDSTTDATVNAPSMACLSCHDGVSAVNSVVNAPGRGTLADGLFDAAGVTITGVEATPNTLANIGDSSGDLSNDHPISIAYNYNATPSLNPASLKDPDVNTIGGKTIRSLLRYPDGTTTGVKTRVECGTCHDPHLPAAPGSTEVNYLRVSNVGSALCISCHDK